MTDPFKSHETGLTSPARNGLYVTPNDSADLPITCRALYVGVAGDVNVILADDSVAVTFKEVPGGTILPVQVKRVKDTLTTATEIVGLY